MSDQMQTSVAQLRASVQILTFDPGVYRVGFTAERSLRAETGLMMPCARLDPPVGMKPGAVAIMVQGENGWLSRNGDTAVVQVASGRAQLLLTTYQISGTESPPSLHVQRLDSVQATPAPATAGGLRITAHVQGRGDIAASADGWVGLPRSGQLIEGFAIAGAPPGLLVEYHAVLGPDWTTPWVSDGEFAGSRGLALPAQGLAVRLGGPAAARFRGELTARFVDGTESGPSPLPHSVHSPAGVALEAFRLVLTETPDAVQPEPVAETASLPAPKRSAAGRHGSTPARRR